MTMAARVYAAALIRPAALCVLALTSLGLALRLAAARGDLWLDEIWSLQNLEQIHTIGGIFWGISQDNNHFLNSLWLWVTGPNASPIVIRLESIICGVLTIPVAARLCGRAGAVAALAGAALVAGSDLFVHYGSEARGYAGLLLMIFVAAEALEHFLENAEHAEGDRTRRRRAHLSRLAFGLAVGLGALFHLTMLIAAACLVVATLLRLALREVARTRAALMRLAGVARDLAIPCVLGAAPAVGCVIAGILVTHTIILGTQIPFSFPHLAQGLATLIEATLGLPYDVPPLAALAVGAGLVGFALFAIPKDRCVLPLTVLLLPPLGAAVLRVPNVHIARFHLVGSLGLVLFASEGLAWLVAARRNVLAFVLAAGVVSGNGVHVAQLMIYGRGDYHSLVRLMEKDGAGTYASNMPPEIIRTVRFYDRRFGHRLIPDPRPDWCKAPPDWYLLSNDAAGEARQRRFGPAACGAAYRREMVEVPARLSGLRIALYRHLP